VIRGLLDRAEHIRRSAARRRVSNDGESSLAAMAGPPPILLFLPAGFLDRIREADRRVHREAGSHTRWAQDGCPVPIEA
jgi:hypothetical protein